MACSGARRTKEMVMAERRGPNWEVGIGLTLDRRAVESLSRGYDSTDEPGSILLAESFNFWAMAPQFGSQSGQDIRCHAGIMPFGNDSRLRNYSTLHELSRLAFLRPTQIDAISTAMPYHTFFFAVFQTLGLALRVPPHTYVKVWSKQEETWAWSSRWFREAGSSFAIWLVPNTDNTAKGTATCLRILPIRETSDLEGT
ncbi:hypothetical protein CH63R_11683 [Colletotrichum higginsianum IMI 349063]|uniref:Uncharacterized protein n=1 Tax=Colletotrichum higginsianum (strain IMI 349063) TaxID=759273 RepID=A0A1B7XZ01_COLHI|nr:hypothetical protein CH63R_11683 [Colletotrichum higginsianum IMI 349063]OBR04980.1 hypothetical protein CH63R_11683 [Colletotrichum higginsianum IMI 349063]